MNRKTIGILILLLGLLIISFLIYVMFFSGMAEPLVNKESSQQKSTEQTVKQPVISNKIKVNLEAFSQNDVPKEDGNGENASISQSDPKKNLIRIASSFTERFGSYSNHSNFHNIKDLNVFMSREMNDWAQNYIFEKNKEGMVSDIYYGIVTKAISAEIIVFDEAAGKASVSVMTRRMESVGSMDNNSDVFEQKMIIDYIKEVDIWKINKATWQER